MTDRLHLARVEWRDGRPEDDEFPFSLPCLRRLEGLEFTTPITFFVGENGSGKSTLLEAIAAGLSLPTVGSAEVDRDETLAPARRLAAALRFVRPRVAGRGSFFRAEDAFGFTKRVAEMLDELSQLDRKQEYWDLVNRYGSDPDAKSHGEAFLHFLALRCPPRALSVLDEPETPLSPFHQLALLMFLRDRAAEGAQFIVATHSPC